MSVNMIQTISVTAFVFAGIFVVVALILWVTLDVHGIIDSLNGRAAERQMRDLRAQNVRTQIVSSLSDCKHIPVYQKEEETVPLRREEGTAVLPEEEMTSWNGQGLVLNEVIVHTKEEIRII